MVERCERELTDRAADPAGTLAHGQNAEQIARTVREINRRDGIAVVVVDQNLDFVARMGAHCHLVDKGRIVFDCPAKEIVNDAKLQRQYLGV